MTDSFPGSKRLFRGAQLFHNEPEPFGVARLALAIPALRLRVAKVAISLLRPTVFATATAQILFHVFGYSRLRRIFNMFSGLRRLFHGKHFPACSPIWQQRQSQMTCSGLL